MADIYDLAIQGAKRRASNQFGDISGDTFTGQLQTMQFLNNLITTKTNRDNVRDENTFSQLLKNLGSANNEVQLDNFKTLLDNASVSPNNQISLDSMYNIYTNKRAGHSAGQIAYGAYDKNPEKFKLTYEQLNEMDFGFDEAGNKVNPDIGQSKVDLLLQEADDVAVQIAHLENAGQYKYGSTPNSVVLERLKRYQGQLAQVQKAWFGGLTSEEIDVILSGADYTKVQDNKLKAIDRAYEKNRTEENKWLGKQMTFLQKLKNNDADGMSDWFEQWRGETDTGELGQAFKDNLPSADTKINTTEKGEIIMDESLLLVKSTFESLVKRAGLNQTALVNERKKWQKYGTEDLTGQSMFEASDESVKTEDDMKQQMRELGAESMMIDSETGATISPQNVLTPKTGEVVGETEGGRVEEIKQRLNEIESTIGANTEQKVIEPLMKEGIKLREELKNIEAGQTTTPQDTAGITTPEEIESAPNPTLDASEENVEEFEVSENAPTEQGALQGILDSDYTDFALDVAKWGALSQADKIAIGTWNLTKGIGKSAQFISTASRMSIPNITKFLESDVVKSSLDTIAKKQAQIDNLAPGAHGSRAKLTKDLDDMIKKTSKNLASTYKVREIDMDRLLRNPNRWNWMKYKANIYTKVGSGAGKIGSNIILGEIVKGQLEARTDYEVGTAAEYILPEGFSRTGELLETVGLGYATKKVIDKTFIPRLFKMIVSEKGKKVLKEKLSLKAYRNLLGASKVAKKFGRFGAFAAAAYGGYTLGADIVDAVNNFTEEGPIMARGPEMEAKKKARKEKRDTQPLNHMDLERMFEEHHEEFLSSIKEKDYDLDTDIDYTPSLKEKSPTQKWESNIIMPSKRIDPVMMRGPEFKLKREESERLRSLGQFKDKYNLSQKAINLLSKLKSPKIGWSQRKKIQKELNKELKKLGLYK